jgi:hypothetical protein
VPCVVDKPDGQLARLPSASQQNQPQHQLPQISSHGPFLVRMIPGSQGELTLASFADSFASLAVKSFNRKGRKVREGRTFVFPA